MLHIFSEALWGKVVFGVMAASVAVCRVRPIIARVIGSDSCLMRPLMGVLEHGSVNHVRHRPRQPMFDDGSEYFSAWSLLRLICRLHTHDTCVEVENVG